MSSKNKFGFGTLETKSAVPPRRRSPGPMGTAVREAAESLQDSTNTKVEKRRQNATDAKEFRQAKAEGLILVALPLDAILTDDLPRDRLALEAVAQSDEMDELVASIRARGQKEPIEVFVDGAGGYQLKKGWRRLTALRQLFAETSDEKFSTIVARVAVAEVDRLALYVDMVEENIIREDLTFAEMAQLAITAAQDTALEDETAEALVNKLYASLHKMKRSYIRSFVYLLDEVGGALQWPKDVSRNLGVDVSRKLKAGGDRDALVDTLAKCQVAEDQTKALAAFLVEARAPRVKSTPREKFEFHVGATKVTARSGECRIVDKLDYTQVPKDRLERAIRAFKRELKEEGNPRVTTL